MNTGQLTRSKYITAAILSLMMFFFTACGGEKATKPALKSYVVSWQMQAQRLFFAGIVQPLRENSVIAPIDAVIETLHCHYGQLVNKGDTLATLSSNELQRQFNEVLTDYLKAKDNFSIARAKFTGTQSLWDAGLLSKNNFLSEKSSVDTARITLMQATHKLSDMLEKMEGIDKNQVAHLNIAEFDKVRQALSGQHNRIYLKAPATGILLYPPKSNEEKHQQLHTGSAIKRGQVIGLIGDLSGISVEIDVPEIDIGKIKQGMKAKVTGVAFGKEPLLGKVVAINAQASGGGNGLPSFTALVEVASLSKAEQARIKVGMSASIELMIDNERALYIPIAAIKQDKGQSKVRIKGSDNKETWRTITTGAADVDRVIVESGLAAGELIVYD